MQISRLCKAALAAGMALVFAVQTPSVAFAGAQTTEPVPEDKKQSYVSDIAVSTASSESEAKKALTDSGRAVLDTDLSSVAGSFTYIGYSLTDDPQQALTDIRLLDSSAGVSAGNFESASEVYSTAAEQLVADINIAVDEYRTNYRYGKTCAGTAKELLDMFVWNSDAADGQPLGEFLLDRSTGKQELNELFLKSPLETSAIVVQCLLIACAGDGNDTLLGRLSAIGKDVPDDYAYYEDAYELCRKWGELQTGLYEYTQAPVSLSDGKEAVAGYEAGLTDTGRVNYIKYGSMYEMLSATPYGNDGNTTLASLFTIPEDYMETENILPLVKVLTKGQRALMSYVSLEQLLFAGGDSKLVENVRKQTSAISGSLENVSVFTEDTNGILENAQCLTNGAAAYAISSGDNSWILKGVDVSAAEESLYGVGAFVSMVHAISPVYMAADSGALGENDCNLNGYTVCDSFLNSGSAGGINDWCYNMTNGALPGYSYCAQLSHYGACISLGAIMTAAQVYNGAAGGGTTIGADSVPVSIVDSPSANAVQTYALYSLASPANASAGTSVISGRNAWVAVYYTKDSNAGKPITDKIFLQIGESVASETGRDTLALFGSDEAFDLSFGDGRDSSKAITLSFVRDKQYAGGATPSDSGNSGDTPDAKSTDVRTLAIYAVAGAAAGAIVGAVSVYFFQRNKRRRIDYDDYDIDQFSE